MRVCMFVYIEHTRIKVYDAVLLCSHVTLCPCPANGKLARTKGEHCESAREKNEKNGVCLCACVCVCVCVCACYKRSCVRGHGEGKSGVAERTTEGCDGGREQQ